MIMEEEMRGGRDVMCMMEDGFMMIHILFTTYLIAASYSTNLLARGTVARTDPISSIDGNPLHAVCQGTMFTWASQVPPTIFFFFFFFFFKKLKSPNPSPLKNSPPPPPPPPPKKNY
jgi:hypothetical protein